MLRPIGVLQKTRLAKSFQETCTSEQVQQSRFFFSITLFDGKSECNVHFDEISLEILLEYLFAEKFQPCCLYSSPAMYEKAIFNANQLN